MKLKEKLQKSCQSVSGLYDSQLNDVDIQMRCAGRLAEIFPSPKVQVQSEKDPVEGEEDRERETLWSDQNKARLVQFIASDRLEISREELQQRMTELSILLPDIVSRYSSMKPELLAEILESIDRVAMMILDLRNAFPKTNISAMIARAPSLLLADIQSIITQAQQTCVLLEVDELDSLIEQYPLFLDASAVEEVLEELQRLMPGNAQQHLIRNPSLLLSTVRGKARLGEPADN